MKKIIAVCLLVGLMGFPINVMAGESEMLRVFEALRVSNSVSDREYDKLYRAAEMELNILKRTPSTDMKFLGASEACFSAYSRVKFDRMVAAENLLTTGRSRAEAEADIRSSLDAIDKSMATAAALLDKLYSFVK